MKPKGTSNKPTKGEKKNREKERLKKLKDYEDHKLLDAEIVRYGNCGYKKDNSELLDAEQQQRYPIPHVLKLLDAEVAQYESKNVPTKGTKKSKVNVPTKGTKKNKVEEERRKMLKDYEDQKLFYEYKSWFLTRSHATSGAELLFVLREYEQLGQLFIQGLILSPAHLEICLLLKQERKRLEHKMHKEAEASVEQNWKRNVGNKKHATRAKFYELMEEGEKHLKSSELFKWSFTPLGKEIAKGIEASVKKELGAAKQKDKGWEEDLQDKKSAIKRAMKEAKKQFNNLEFFDPECTPLKEETAKEVEASVNKELGAEKQKDKGWEEEQEDKKSAIKQVMKEAKKHLKNFEILDPECTSSEEKTAKGEASMEEDERLSLDEEFTKLLCEVEEEPMTFPSTMAAASTSTTVDVYKRWSLEEEVNKLIDQTLQRSFPRLGEKSMTYTCKEDYGDYQCENVLHIWPKLLEDGTNLEGPKSVGTKIKIELEKRSDMIEGTPVIRNIGFVNFKLSGKWMAKSLYKMLRYGIDTWAPELPVERVVVEIPDYESPIWNSIVGTEADIIRSNFIRHTLIRMLEYSKVFVKSSKDESRRGVISSLSDICIEERDGDVVISAKVEGEIESLNFGKRDIEDISDSLKNLRYELEEEKADWIVCLSHVRNQEFVELCFAAAEHAGWIPTEEHRGLCFAGFRTHAEAGKLVHLLQKALTRCNYFVKQGKAAEYTAERVFTCVLGYEYLKNHRMAECTFKVDEMISDEGDTFLYLLNTKSQVLSVLENAGKDNNLQNVTELIWEKVEVVENDNGRALGLHLLKFTQVLKESCLSVLPHILCRYLHSLSQKFTSYHSSCSCVPQFGSVAETSRLILCEATAAVMDKCFNLLGITPVSTFGQSFNEPLKLLLDLESRMGPKDRFISRCDSVNPSSARDPLKNSRFELVAIRPRISKDSKFRSGKLFAHIKAEDKYGLLSDGWLSTLEPDFGMISLYDRVYDSVNMYNHGLVSIGNPNARHSVPLTKSSLCIHAELLATSEREDAFFHLMTTKRVKMPNFWNKEGEGECAAGVIMVGGKDDDMSALMYCCLLKDAVDASVEMKFRPKPGLKVKGEIYAYYGREFPYSADSVEKGFYMAKLLEPDTDLVVGPVPLTRSRMAVPKDGSLVIEAEFVDAKTGNVVLKGRREFYSKIKGNSTYSIKCKRCALDLKVDWKYQA